MGAALRPGWERTGTGGQVAKLVRMTPTGKVIGSLRRRHRTAEFEKFLAKLEREVPAGPEVHLVLDNLDNYATHKTEAIKKWLLAHPRFQLPLTPAGSSWLNLVERWFAEPTNTLLRRGVHRSVQALERDIRARVADCCPSSKAPSPVRSAPG
ncbi:transposase [Kitasatospora sp. NBC_01302]|uniref:transposase n=1 Tax=Kitasatospora sp. NBC_01302 TaxID=2903575 RepID=UPI003FA3D245